VEGPDARRRGVVPATASAPAGRRAAGPRRGRSGGWRAREEAAEFSDCARELAPRGTGERWQAGYARKYTPAAPTDSKWDKMASKFSKLLENVFSMFLPNFKV